MGVASAPIPSRSVFFHYFINPAPFSVDQVRNWPQQIKSAGFDAVFTYVTQGYLEVLMQIGDQDDQPWPSAYWKPKDGLTVFREACAEWNLQLHILYPPTQDLRGDVSHKHPNWMALSTPSSVAGTTIEIADLEASERIVRTAKFIAEFYQPEGIQLEEPYYQSGPIIIIRLSLPNLGGDTHTILLIQSR